jgi:hypothetical protein
MAVIVQTNKSLAKIRVALIIEGGKIRPVWFVKEVDNPARDRIHIKQINSVWSHTEGAAKIINFAVRDGTNCYRLSLNTKDFCWNMAIAEETPFPPPSATSTWRFRRDEH